MLRRLLRQRLQRGPVQLQDPLLPLRAGEARRGVGVDYQGVGRLGRRALHDRRQVLCHVPRGGDARDQGRHLVGCYAFGLQLLREARRGGGRRRAKERGDGALIMRAFYAGN